MKFGICLEFSFWSLLRVKGLNWIEDDPRVRFSKLQITYWWKVCRANFPFVPQNYKTVNFSVENQGKLSLC